MSSTTTEQTSLPRPVLFGLLLAALACVKAGHTILQHGSQNKWAIAGMEAFLGVICLSGDTKAHESVAAKNIGWLLLAVGLPVSTLAAFIIIGNGWWILVTAAVLAFNTLEHFRHHDPVLPGISILVYVVLLGSFS